MIQRISAQNLDQIKNPVFRLYAARYVEIDQDFLSQIKKLGLEFEPGSDLINQLERLKQMQANGIEVRNDHKSLVYKHISPSCIACRKAEDSETFFISLRCHRDCYFCFNPNQVDYQHYLDHQRDLQAELRKMATSGRKLEHIALTGGEPLLYPDETLNFFKTARQLFPVSYLRLYTSGDQLNHQLLSALAESGLDEIRISIRLHDSEKARHHTYQSLTLSLEHIPHVLVEMPVLPGTYESMTELIDRLDEIGIEGINLLEFCFPLNNVDEFKKQGFKIKTPPFRVLNNYWYAGGLPIAGSEEVCLDLIDYGIKRNLHLGLHYCSLENKHTGQIFSQNIRAPESRNLFFSPRDFFLKSAKVFGTDIPAVKQALSKVRRAVFSIDSNADYLEFHPRFIPLLVDLDIVVAISYNVYETRADGNYLRELRVDYASPRDFNLERDL